ncbi:MAG: hypothetical protein AAGF81_06345 [Pseudomonadota bacterium]
MSKSAGSMTQFGRRPVQFDFVASTGRTATTFLASALNGFCGVAACHEGYLDGDKGQDALLPLINLENAQAFTSPGAAAQAVADKRSRQVIADAAQVAGAERLVDVAYYNSTLAHALLNAHPSARMLGVIRNCASFVRSATTITGEDPLPVGWADPDKPMSQREMFIEMGRIRPARQSAAKAEWKGWGAVRRNVWLWEETNLLLCAAKDAFPGRVSLVRFETFAREPAAFWAHTSAFFQLPEASAGVPAGRAEAVNKKPAGYQIGPQESWAPADQAAAQKSQHVINERALYDC